MAADTKKTIVLSMREVTGAEISAFVTQAAQYGGSSDEVNRIINEDRHFILSQAGSDLVGYSLQINGAELFVTAAYGSSSQYDLFDVINDVLHEQATGFQSIAFRTIRPGLVRKAIRRGYSVSGQILRKKL